MLEIARLTMTGPKTLLLDEPSVGLMPKLVDEVYEEIARLKEERYTILIVDQNVKKAIGIADYVYALALGENRYEGPRDEIAQRLDEIVKEWIGWITACSSSQQFSESSWCSGRSEERRVGTEGVSTFISWWSRNH